MKSFRQRIQARKEQFEDGVAEKMKVAGFEVHANLTEDTPVDTGWAASNWLVGLSVPIRTTVGSPADVDSSSAIKAFTTLSKYTYEKGDLFITNNVKYIKKLNDGSSEQAPAGFVQIAIDRATKKIKKIKVFKR